MPWPPCRPTRRRTPRWGRDGTARAVAPHAARTSAGSPATTINVLLSDLQRRQQRGGRGLIWPAHIQRQPQPGQSQREDQVSPAVLDQDSRAGPLHRHRFNAAVHLVWQSLPDRRLRTPGRIGQAVSGNRHDYIARTQDRGGLAGRQVDDDAVGLPGRSSRPNDARVGGRVQAYGSGDQRENSEPRAHNCCRAALRMCHGRVRRATRTLSSRSVAGGSTRADLQPVRRRVRQIAAPESDSGHKRPAFGEIDVVFNHILGIRQRSTPGSSGVRLRRAGGG
jgi:hypothetical protein